MSEVHTVVSAEADSLAQDTAAGIIEQEKKKGPRPPRFADRVMGHAHFDYPAQYGHKAGSVAPFPALFAHHVRSTIAQGPVIVADNLYEWLKFIGGDRDQWDYTRDIPNMAPIATTAWIEWQSENPAVPYTGVLCKAVVKNSLEEGAQAFEAASGDYDSQLALESCRKAESNIAALDPIHPTVFFQVCTVFDGVSIYVKEFKRKLLVVQPVGAAAFTMTSAGVPVPGSMVLRTWDESEAAADRLQAALLPALMCLNFMHAGYTQSTPVPLEPSATKDKASPVYGRLLCEHHTLDFRVLLRKLWNDGAIGKQGLRAGLNEMRYLFAQGERESATVSVTVPQSAPKPARDSGLILTP